MNNDLVQRILAKDYSVTLLAKQTGPSANPDLINLLRESDDEVRQIAVYCLDETGGASASAALVHTLLDPEPVVAAAAARALHHHPDGRIAPLLLQVYDQRPDPFILREAGLLFGRLGKDADVVELKKRYDAETDPLAREGLMVSLAKLGDDGARDDFKARLEAAGSIDDKKRAFDDAAFIHEDWLVKPLVGKLDDTSPVIRIGIDGMPQFPDALRACDLALNLIVEILGLKTSFAISRSVNYDAAQIDEVRSHAEVKRILLS